MAVLPSDSLTGPLSPKFNLNQDTRDPLNRPENKGGRRTNWVPLGVFFLFSMLAIPLTLSQLSSRQDIRQQAAEPVPTQIINPTPTPTPISAFSDAPAATSSTQLAPNISESPDL